MGALKAIEEDISLLLEHDDMKWWHRAKANWYTMGDKNTKYFHVYATQRRRRNKVNQVQDVHRNSVKEWEQIDEVFKFYFQNLFN